MVNLNKDDLIDALSKHGWVFTGDSNKQFDIWTKAFNRSILVISLIGKKHELDSIKLDLSNNNGDTLFKMKVGKDLISRIKVTSDQLTLYKGNAEISFGDVI